MNEYLALAKNIESFVRKKTVTVEFNVIDQLHANENAHTRILVQLLQINGVAQSFLDYIYKSESVVGMKEWSKDCSEPIVEEFSSYMDAKITVGSDVIIIENKVKDAVDQDAQIDRYVNVAKPDGGNVFVIYLTKDGAKKVSESSFHEAKQNLAWESETKPGRFLCVNYKEHILDWLENHLLLNVQSVVTQPFLISGLVQYIHYLKGPDVLGTRTSDDPYAESKGKIIELLRGKKQRVGIDFCTWWSREILKTRAIARSDNGLFMRLPLAERREVLKRAFYSWYSKSLVEGEMYGTVDVVPGAACSMGVWASCSPVQIDLWSEDRDDDDQSESRINAVVNMAEKNFQRFMKYTYNGQPAIRFFVETVEDVALVIKCVSPSVQDASQHHAGNGDLESSRPEEFWSAYDILPWLWEQIDTCDESWDKVTFDYEGKSYDVTGRYPFVNGWAINLSNDMNSGHLRSRVIQFSPHKDQDESVVVKKIEALSSSWPYWCHRWSGRVVYNFPVVTKEEASALCAVLHKIRSESTTDMNNI